MSIRYECDECGSVFKIKDSLAGTKGKCPSCQKKFIVPQKGPDSGIDLDSARDSKIEKGERRPEEEAPFASPSSTGRNGSTLPVGGVPAQESPSQKKITPEPAPVRPASSGPKSAPSLLPPPVEPTAVTPAAPETTASPEMTSEAAAAEAEESAPGDDFDVDSFLMDQEAAAQAKASAGLATPTAAPAKQPQYDKQGRRILGAALARPGSPASPAASAAAEAVDAALEGGQVKVGPLPMEPRRPLIPFTFKGSLKLLRRRALWIVLGATLIAATFFLSNRLLAVQLTRPVLSAVSGTVTLDGKPLPNVMVHLTPVFAQEGKDTRGQPLRLRDSIGVTDENGFYSVQYLDGLEGAPLGNVRIWVETIQPAHLKTIPASYLSNASADIRSVKEAGNETRFDLKMKSQSQQ